MPRRAIRDGYPRTAQQLGVQLDVTRTGGESWVQALQLQLKDEIHDLFTDPNAETMVEVLDLLEAYGQALGWEQTKLDELRQERNGQYGGFLSQYTIEAEDHRAEYAPLTEAPPPLDPQLALHSELPLTPAYPLYSVRIVGQRPATEDLLRPYDEREAVVIDVRPSIG